MYRVISFYFKDNHLTVSTDKGPLFTNKETADVCANKLNYNESEKSSFERSIIHGVHISVEIISKGKFYEAKWNEFCSAWNDSVKPDTLNPIEAFNTWINHYNYLTAKQYIKTL